MNRAEFMRAHGYNHAEAFCLMKYATRDGKTIEWLWNSRDGVTPFIIRSQSGDEMNHVDFHLDCYLPNYTPLPGERIFVDMTLEMARAYAERRVTQRWDDGEQPMSAMFATKEAAIEELTKSMLRPGAPAVVVAGEWSAT